jgi:hypothetical protein
MKVQNLSNGDLVELQSGAFSARLPLQAASWVRQGSVVINDYCLDVPANGIAGSEPVRVALQRARGAGVHAGQPNGGPGGPPHQEAAQ